MQITKEDRRILGELAVQVAEIAALPVQDETRALWKRSNGLSQVRPMVVIDQVPWHEMDVAEELSLKTSDGFVRNLERRLRETLYRWRHMRADMVVEKHITVGKAIRNTGFGLRVDADVASYDPSNPVKGYRYHDQLASEEDLEKIKTPRIALDIEATAKREAVARELLDGLLDVRMTGVSMGFMPWDLIPTWHGIGNSLVDLIDRPDFIHKLIARLSNAFMAFLDQLEDQGLLAYDIPAIHCTGAYTDELPSADFDPKRPTARDTWTMGQAQVFSSVSPAMHEEFEIEYAIPWYERFGLGYYGCCEPLHDKIDIIERLPRVRKISISPWADVAKAAKRLAGRYVMSRKPSPAFLATDSFDRDAVRADLQQTYDTAKREGCAVEFILKDISTVRYQPERLWEWEHIARSVVGG